MVRFAFLCALVRCAVAQTSDVVRVKVQTTTYNGFASGGVPADVGWGAALATQMAVPVSRVVVSGTEVGGEVAVSFRWGDCTAGRCGAGQECLDEDGDANGVYVCRCLAPKVGWKQDAAATCIDPQGDCATGRTACHMFGQECADPDLSVNDVFLCSCPWRPDVPPRQNLQADCGPDVYAKNNATPPELMTAFLNLLSCCPRSCVGTSVSSECAKFGVESVSAGTPCGWFGPNACRQPSCLWDLPNAVCNAAPSADDDDDGNVLLIILIVVGSCLYCTCVLLTALCWKMRQKGQPVEKEEPLLPNEVGRRDYAAKEVPPPPPADADGAREARVMSAASSNPLGSIRLADDLSMSNSPRAAQAAAAPQPLPAAAPEQVPQSPPLLAHPIEAQPDDSSDDDYGPQYQIGKLAPPSSALQSKAFLSLKTGDGPRAGDMYKTVDPIPPLGTRPPDGQYVAVDPETRRSILRSHHPGPVKAPPEAAVAADAARKPQVTLVVPPSARTGSPPGNLVVHPLGGALPQSLAQHSPQQQGVPQEHPMSSMRTTEVQAVLPPPSVIPAPSSGPPSAAPPSGEAGMMWPGSAPSPPGALASQSPARPGVASPGAPAANELQVQEIPLPEEAFGSLQRASKGELISPGGVGQPHEYERRRKLSPEHPSLLARRMQMEGAADPQQAAGLDLELRALGVQPYVPHGPDLAVPLSFEDASVVGEIRPGEGIVTPVVPRFPLQGGAEEAGAGSNAGYAAASTAKATPGPVDTPAMYSPGSMRMTKTDDRVDPGRATVPGRMDTQHLPKPNFEDHLSRGGARGLRRPLVYNHSPPPAKNSAALFAPSLRAGLPPPSTATPDTAAATVPSPPFPSKQPTEGATPFALPLTPPAPAGRAAAVGGQRPIRMLPPDPRSPHHAVFPTPPPADQFW
eukprot:TRINITY_DN5169_c0_g1_i1.p1 TRINITY_DN5169_c0_g1~~TRINITY_DN5169_c0_g1_i1.p1  ORF type:complete len:914 (+),score=198.87 TRINITY_DN5169_c0_g1_i1:91-2832(+)